METIESRTVTSSIHLGINNTRLPSVTRQEWHDLSLRHPEPGRLYMRLNEEVLAGLKSFRSLIVHYSYPK